MDPEFWLNRWREGRTGWHREGVMPLLQKHWPGLAVPQGTRVLVPLAGKSLDMLWLSRQGLRVLGVELSPIAVDAFLADNRLDARKHAARDGVRYTIASPPGGVIEIINGDVFEVDPATLADCGAFYDRAAMIALPAAMRERLVAEVYAGLAPESQGLLITLDYPQHEMDGPPFSVDEAEVHRLFDTDWVVERLERRDIFAEDPQFAERGATALHTSVYRISKRAVQTFSAAA